MTLGACRDTPPTAVARPPFEQLPPERRNEILRIAAEEFARSGFHGTSYNRLLGRLKLGKSSAYYYFADKRDLFLTALRSCYQTFFEATKRLERPHSVEGFWAFVARASARGYGLMLEDPTAAHLFQCMQREQALLGELVSTDFLASMEGFYREVIDEGQRLGAVRTDLPQNLLVDLVRDVAMSFDRWFVVERDRGAAAASPADAARHFTDVTRRICSPPAPPALLAWPDRPTPPPAAPGPTWRGPPPSPRLI